MPIDWNALTDFIAEHERFVLTSHIRPDCDALGSELGMALVLESLGKEVRIFNGQETPPAFAFIDPTHRIQVIGRDATVDEVAAWLDALIVLDTSAWAQLGPMGDVLKQTKATKAILDHHQLSDDLGGVEFKDTDAEATGRLVVDAAEALGVALTPEMARPLFAAFATDTGWFRFNNTTEITYQCAAKLVAAGASPAELYQQLYERDTLPRIRLKGRILERLTPELGGRLMHTYVLSSDFAELGAHPSDTEDVINTSLRIEGVVFAVIVIEQPQGGFKISFRSRCAADCSQIAAAFGGGGHKAAAGAYLTDPFTVARKKVVDAAKEAVAEV